MLRATYDVVVVGGGHNGLTAAAYLARAGRSVLVLERLDHVGGAAVSARVFPGVDARLSRYAYLVSLLPREVVRELGLRVTLRRRRFASYTPVGEAGLLVDTHDDAATRASFARLTGGESEFRAWTALYGRIGRLAARLAPTLLEPLRSRDELRRLVDDDATWHDLFEAPIGEGIRRELRDDVVRGVVATDALIGTFADLDDLGLAQNRCFLYHVIGNGTGDWDVPVGGMGAVSGALLDAALAAGAEVRVRAEVTAVDPAGEVTFLDDDGGAHRVGAGHVLAGCAPATLARLLGEVPAGRLGAAPGAAMGAALGAAVGGAPEGAQLKVNMLLERLPQLRDDVDPTAAFSGTFHVNESYPHLQEAYRQAAAGQVPALPPAEIYCHSLTDPSILGPRATGVHTLTLFGLHLPARLFREDNEARRAEALAATLRSLDSVLAEPLEDCLLRDAEGRPCIEARTPVDLESDVGLPGGHIFHRPLSWPFAEEAEDVGTWGVETAHSRVLLCGAGARRGGGVSGIPGRAAAMAVLGR